VDEWNVKVTIGKNSTILLEAILNYLDDGFGLWCYGSSDDVVDSKPFYLCLYGRF